MEALIGQRCLFMAATEQGKTSANHSFQVPSSNTKSNATAQGNRVQRPRTACKIAKCVRTYSKPESTQRYLIKVHEAAGNGTGQGLKRAVSKSPAHSSDTNPMLAQGPKELDGNKQSGSKRFRNESEAAHTEEDIAQGASEALNREERDDNNGLSRRFEMNWRCAMYEEVWTKSE